MPVASASPREVASRKRVVPKPPEPPVNPLLDAPHTESNYLLQEMGYRVARKHATRLRIVAGAGLFVVPFALLLMIIASKADGLAIPLGAFAMASAAVGVLVERWLFFAEAKHVVTLYYGTESA